MNYTAPVSDFLTFFSNKQNHCLVLPTLNLLCGIINWKMAFVLYIYTCYVHLFYFICRNNLSEMAAGEQGDDQHKSSSSNEVNVYFSFFAIAGGRN